MAQTGTLSPVAQKLNSLRSSGDFAEYDIFERTVDPGPRDPYAAYLSSYDYFNWDADAVKVLLAEKPNLLRIAIPGDEAILLELYRTDFFASGYNIKTSEGEIFAHSDMAFYHGQIAGRIQSLVAVSVFSDEIRIMYSGRSGSFRIQQTDGNKYIRFNENDQLDVEPKQCFVDDSHIMLSGNEEKVKTEYRSTGNCVEIYFECDLQSYQDNNSSITETEEWITALFNEVSILYENEMIPISISQIKVWTTTDPYISDVAPALVLETFVSEISTNGYQGRLAHMLTTRTLGGGVAYLNVLCSTNHQCAVSADLSTNIVPFPTYSWNVNVVAHEMGHNFGSNHTHECVWNGDSTQIDDCGSYEGDSGGSCYDYANPILPENGGTVMSYCHLVSGVGINPSNGFGPLPGDVLRNSYNGAGCNTGDCFVPDCTTLSDPVDSDQNVDIATIMNWNSVAGADGYRVTMGTSSGATNIANNVDVGAVTNYNPNGLPFNVEVYVTITPYNYSGDAEACVEESFHTEANIQPLCTQLSFPANGAVDIDFDVTIVWPHATGNQSSYILNVGTTSGGGEIISNANVGNITSYNLISLPEDTTIYVRVTPVGTQGSASGCTITNFKTKQGLAGEDCSDASPISCGNSVSGSTIDALDDDVPYCGTSNTTAGVWYTFTGDGSNVTLSMCGAADYDTKLSVYRGSCAQLICVGGNDDWTGCNLASQVSFTSIANANYFVLVHGWDNSVGDFYLTMACEDPPYCPSQGIISDDEWIADFSMGPLSNSSGQTLYSDFTNQIINVIPGETYDLSATPGFLQQSYNEYFHVWIDYNSDGDFDDAGEQVFESGPDTTTAIGTVTIPATAPSGDRLLRVAMKFNSLSGPCDIFPYGEVEEYTLHVRCDYVTNTNDGGAGSLREALNCVASGDTVYFSSALQGQTITLTSVPISINKDVIFLADPAINISVSGVSVSKVFQILGGNSVVIQGLNIIGGTSSLGNGIDNTGILKLRDVSIHQHAGASGAALLYNQGEVTLEGNCDIKDP